MNDKSPPSPEEIQKEFERFFKDKFGGNVQVFTKTGFNESRVPPEPPTPEPTVGADILSFNLKPKDVKKHLDKYVIGQDDAKKALSIAVCDHYNHVRASILKGEENGKEFEYSKQNVLILGPTGVGKSYLIKHIAQLIGVPFVKADATRFSETGYMGANVDDLIKDLVKQADDDLKLAQFGIVYLDEADKLAAAADRAGRDVSGRGVQFGLLKIMEESEVDLNGGNDMASQMQAMMDYQRHGKMNRKALNTRFILFIVSGAFTGLEPIIRKRIDANKIGFGSDKLEKSDHDNILSRTTTQDLIDFGFEPEFVGRLPIRVACHSLEVEDLFYILKNSKGSIIRQYEEAFSAYNIEVEFTDDALRKVAELAHEQKTGARALMTVCESILRNFKFELPSTYITRLVIDENVIMNPDEELERILGSAPSTDQIKVITELQKFSTKFMDSHDMKLTFDEGAKMALIQTHAQNPEGIQAYLTEKLQGFEHGLKLIMQNTGKSQFVIEKDTLEHPKSTLERWIKDSYMN